MGSRGPAPTDKQTLARRGSPLAKGRADDLTLPSSAPTPPAALDREARAEWKRIVKLLGPRGVLTEGDRGSLAMLCELWSEDRSLGKQLKKMIVGSTVWKRVVTQRNETRKQLVQLYSRFGMTPADRARVKVPTAKSDGDNKARFFGGKGVVGKIRA